MFPFPIPCEYTTISKVEIKGECVGLRVGTLLGLIVVGLIVGFLLGVDVVGLNVVGFVVGFLVGFLVGSLDGFFVGEVVGLLVGFLVGAFVGYNVGRTVLEQAHKRRLNTSHCPPGPCVAYQLKSDKSLDPYIPF
jgi:uncharacterized protein YqgC (DUF456 family)